MKYHFILSICFLLAVPVLCDHLVVGNIANRVVLANHTRVEYNAIPFMKRVKYFFYTQQDNRLIQLDIIPLSVAPPETGEIEQEILLGNNGIQALDTYHSKASINITAGGVGYTFVNLRLKSERGRGLSYDIGIYVQDYFYH